MQLVADSEALERVIISALGQRVTGVPRLSFFFNRTRMDVLERITAEYHAYVVEDWDSAGNFLEHGVGFCMTVDGRIASVCYSATSGNGIVPIQIDTREEYRRKGLAFITCAAFIEHCLEYGLWPRWECDVSNVASASLARMLGFVLHSELTVFRMTE